MEFVYVVIENGEAYPNAYKTYADVLKVVNNKHKAELDRQLDENPEFRDEILGSVNPKEDMSGRTLLYIEKGIEIMVHKLPVVHSAHGGKRGRSRSKSKSKRRE